MHTPLQIRFLVMPSDTLPSDFDPEYYLILHPDVKAAGRDPAEHYLAWGRKEGRAYRRPRTPAELGISPITEKLLTHPVTDPLPTLQLDSQPAREDAGRLAIAVRLLKAYQAAEHDQPALVRQGEDLWSKLENNELHELLQIIRQDNPSVLAAYLQQFGQSFVWFGGITTCVDGYNRDRDAANVALSYWDKLVSLAEALGVIRAENPEHGPWGENLRCHPATLVKALEARLGISIAPPQGIIHTDGVRCGDALLHYRHIIGLYGASRVRQLVNDGAVCEIGGGLGITAMYAHKLGIHDYTILDLPVTCLLAGHYLLQAVGPDQVSLFGERDTTGTIRLLPYWQCVNPPADGFTLSFNQDSLPEISDDLVMEYLSHIRRFTTDHFLSINHECFHPRTVHNFVQQAGGYHLVHRSPCWVRKGYLDELYAIH